jgi:hypothetical protein
MAADHMTTSAVILSNTEYLVLTSSGCTGAHHSSSIGKKWKYIFDHQDSGWSVSMMSRRSLSSDNRISDVIAFLIPFIMSGS